MLKHKVTAAHSVLPGIDLAQRIGAWAAQFTPSSEQMARIRASVRDFVGCVAAGTLCPELRPALWLAHGGGVPVWGLADSFDPAGAALVTGTAGSLLQLHDVYLPGASHPSAPVIAAAWAALHDCGGASPAEFLAAVAIGYEVANRVAEACVPAQLLAGSAPTGTAGAIGAAVAAARLRKLGAAGMARAVGNAALLLPATPFAAMRAHGSSVPLHAGLAARAGYEAASLAREATAGSHVLEGDRHGPGLIKLLAGDPTKIEPERWDGATIERVGWKFFPACLATHVALEAVLGMGPVECSSIDEVIIRRAPTALNALVATGPSEEAGLYDRLMSLRWVIARALELGHYSYPDAVANEPGTIRLSRKVKLLDASPPHPGISPDAWAHIEIHAAGRPLIARDYQRPMDDEAGPGIRGWTTQIDEVALRRKFNSLLARAPVPEQQLELLGVNS